MGARTKARKRALDMLFIADVRQSTLDEILREEGERAAAQPQRSSSWPYAHDIVRGVADEAVEFATVLSTDESSGFVNGVLGAIADDLHRSAS